MIELRYKVEQWTEMTEFGNDIQHTEKPVLQFREVIGIDNSNMEGIPIMSEWDDVTTEYVEV